MDTKREDSGVVLETLPATEKLGSNESPWQKHKMKLLL